MNFFSIDPQAVWNHPKQWNWRRKVAPEKWFFSIDPITRKGWQMGVTTLFYIHKTRIYHIWCCIWHQIQITKSAMSHALAIPWVLIEYWEGRWFVLVVKMVHYAILKKEKKYMGNEITIEEKKKMLRVLQLRIHRWGKIQGNWRYHCCIHIKIWYF